MKPKEPCPRCGGVSWYELDVETIMQRCLCGLLRAVYSVRDGMIITHIQSAREAQLPRKDSKMALCLRTVAQCYPNSASTRDIALKVSMTTSEASAQMAVLIHKGLIEKTDARRGRFGGSSWRITRRAVALLKLKEV